MCALLPPPNRFPALPACGGVGDSVFVPWQLVPRGWGNYAVVIRPIGGEQSPSPKRRQSSEGRRRRGSTGLVLLQQSLLTVEAPKSPRSQS